MQALNAIKPSNFKKLTLFKSLLKKTNHIYSYMWTNLAQQLDSF